MNITAEELHIMSMFIYDLCGIKLDETKSYLLESRLSSVAEEAGCKDFSELYCKARYDGEQELRDKIVDAITTNETLFFRDTSPYEALQHKSIPELIDSKSNSLNPKRIRIWSAACSTGQEPYSIAMVLNELIPDIYSWDIQILATDICDSAIEQASLGLYSKFEIQRGMEQRLLSKYFTETENAWKVKDELRGLIAFKKINLMKPFTGMGPFDIIFCRNVAIYFDDEDRKDMFRRMAAILDPHGYMFVGSSESLSDVGPEFTPLHHCNSIFYQPHQSPVST